MNIFIIYLFENFLKIKSKYNIKKQKLQIVSKLTKIIVYTNNMIFYFNIRILLQY